MEKLYKVSFSEDLSKYCYYETDNKELDIKNKNLKGLCAASDCYNKLCEMYYGRFAIFCKVHEDIRRNIWRQLSITFI